MEDGKKSKKPLLSPLLMLFMGTMILANIAGQMDGPIRSLYVQELGASIQQIGLFFTLGAIAPLILQIFGGWISDSVGRLQAIAIGSLGGVASYIVFAVAPSWEWLLLASIGSAMAYSFVGPSFSAFIAEQSTEETRGRVYGITSTMFMVVNIIGPAVGSQIAQGLSFKVLFIVAGGLYSTAALIRVLMARFASKKKAVDIQEAVASPQTPQQSGFTRFKKSAVAVFAMIVGGGLMTWIFISDGVRDVAFSLTSQLMPLYLENEMSLTLVQIGLLQSISATVAMIFMTPAGWLSDKFGERVGIVGGFAIISIGWTVFLMGLTFPHFIISRAIIGIGWALIDPSYNSLISKAVPENLRGIAFGLLSSSLGLISLPMPMIGAWMWDAIYPRFPFYIPLAAMVLLLPVMWIKFQAPEEESAEGSEDALVEAEIQAVAGR